MKEVANKCCGCGWKSRRKTREQCQWIQIEPSKHLVISCLYIYILLTANPVNERFIIHFFDHWRLTDQPAHFRAF